MRKYKKYIFIFATNDYTETIKKFIVQNKFLFVIHD